MGKRETKKKEQMQDEKIFKIMLYATLGVASLFLVKNLISGTMSATIIIASCLAVFVAIIVTMKKMNATKENQYLIVSLALLVLIFIISINSGECYSDDFILLLAAIGMTGMYFVPKYTKYQTILGDIILIALYIINPNKAESLSQYIMCFVLFNVAAIMIYLVIKRGRSFIQSSQVRAEEAEALITSLSEINQELQNNFEKTQSRIDEIQKANVRFTQSADELRRGSDSILGEAEEVFITCGTVQDQMQASKDQVDQLNVEVTHFEQVLDENRSNLEQMNAQILSVKKSTEGTEATFGILQTQMGQITNVIQQLKAIASSTTMLALNASIEAARAGETGAGFAVVATNVQELAVDSKKCSEEVEKVIVEMQKQVTLTMEQLNQSTDKMEESLGGLQIVKDGFDVLNTEFGTLHKNIEEQNDSIASVNRSFEGLKDKVNVMRECTEENQGAVAVMSESAGVYSSNLEMVAEDTSSLRDLAMSMEQMLVEKTKEE